jgi:hypothetical protein
MKFKALVDEVEGADLKDIVYVTILICAAYVRCKHEEGKCKSSLGKNVTRRN